MDGSDRRRLSPIDLRIDASALWVSRISSAAYPDRTFGAGLVPLEIGIVWRMKDRFAVTPFGRVGLVHAGGGVELAVTTSSWTENGVVFRLAPLILADLVTCLSTGEERPATCDGATYYLTEIGAQYRWVFPRVSVALGLSLNGGAVRLRGSSTSIAPALGVTGPRLQLDF